MKLYNFILFCFITSITFCQKQNSEDFLLPLVIEKVDEFYELNEYYQHFIDKSRSLSFEEVKSQKFGTGKLPAKLESIYWYKFKLKPNKTTDFFLLLPSVSDVLIFYVPQKNSDTYQVLKLGQLKKGNPIKIDVAEASIASLDFKSIDFSKPFYINKEIVTDWGEVYFKYPMAVVLTDNKNFIENFMNENSYKDRFQIYSIIIFVSFVFFLVNYIVSKDRNYLNYSLYLFSIALLFSVRLPYLFNVINTIEPKLFQYIRIFSITSASAFYFYFVVSFLNFRANFPKLYKFSLATLKGICIFTVLYILLIIIFPYLPNKVLIMTIFKIAFTLISLCVFTYLLFQKGGKIYKAVLISSLLLIIGNLLSAVTGWSFFFLNTVLIEIIIFNAIVSYNNKTNSKKRFENKFLLEQELINNQNLIEINEVKSKLFANISHEFRTPLTLISGPIDKRLNGSSLNKEDQSDFEMIQRNSNRLLNLVNQLLDLSKLESGHLKLKVAEGNLSVLLKSMASSFQHRAKEKNIDYTINIDDIDNAWFDKDVIEKTVINLLSNAFKYTPKTGDINFNALVIADKLQLKIENDSNILTKEQVENIFNRFYQADDNTEGVGIGLSLVNELVNLSYGTITVDNTSNKTIVFKVILPIKKSKFKPEDLTDVKVNLPIIEQKDYIIETEAETEIKQAIDENLPILLVVDDHEDIRTFVKSAFKNNYQVVEASDGEIGVEKAIELVPDIIISDVMMPKLNGFQLSETLKQDERTSHIPIILLTAKAEDADKFIGLETGADDYITKPFKTKALETRVKNLINSRLKLRERYSQELVLKPTDIAVSNYDAQFLEKVNTVIDENITEPDFSAKDFSNALGMSRMQLHRKLKALTGLSATEFVRSQRLQLAADLLKKSDANVSEIGYSVGFNDHSYFTKCFKEMYGCSPTEYISRQ